MPMELRFKAWLNLTRIFTQNMKQKTKNEGVLSHDKKRTEKRSND